jgi:ammonia channel protein AmtB
MELTGTLGGCALSPSITLAGTYDLRICCNGVLSGLVIVTGICGFVDPWAAAVCGLIAGIIYPLSSHALVSSAGHLLAVLLKS